MSRSIFFNSLCFVLHGYLAHLVTVAYGAEFISGQELPEQFRSAENKIGHLKKSVSNGLIKFTGKCNVFCVAPDLVATAAHCLFQPKSSQSRPPFSNYSIHFASSRKMLKIRIAGSSEERAQLNVLAGHTGTGKTGGIPTNRDWALVRLESRACQDSYFKVSVQKMAFLVRSSQKHTVFQLGYTKSRSKLSYFPYCRINEVSKETRPVLLHNCQIFKGTSGAPLLINSRSGPVVIGLGTGFFFLKKPGFSKRKIPTYFRSIASSAFRKQIEFMQQGQPEKLSRGEIMEIQKKLKSKGYYMSKDDGVFGTLLRQAILEYEYANGLMATGLPSRKLLSSLKST